MSLSKLHRQEIINTLLYDIGRSRFYRDFSVGEFADAHKLSKQSVYRYLNILEAESKIRKSKGKNNYRLVGSHHQFSYSINNLKEDVVWNIDIKSLLHDMPEVALRNCYYAFSEMLNNAIDHSEGTEVKIAVNINAYSVSFQITDNGVGIFAKIASAMQLEEKRFAILELAKGKFTTDPESHSGEGIFFSSKASDAFGIFSDGLVFSAINFRNEESERLFDHEAARPEGTTVLFIVFRDHSVTTMELFDRYTEEPDHYGFTKTIVPVKLLEYGEAQPVFISRSQAKRLLVRFERFERIQLDFSGIDEIGQGFADEVFRVFRSQHPNSQITAINCNNNVDRMIKHVSRH